MIKILYLLDSVGVDLPAFASVMLLFCFSVLPLSTTVVFSLGLVITSSKLLSNPTALDLY